MTDIETVEEGRKRNMARIARCRYPTVVIEGELIEWWRDDAGADLAEVLEHATGWIEEDDPATLQAFDRAWAELDQHADHVVSQTIDALSKGGTVEDLYQLIDAAAQAGNAATVFFTDPDSASRFLAKIAEVAFEQITKEKARPEVTESGVKSD